MRQDVQAPAVGHTEEDVPHTSLGCLANHLALQRKAGFTRKNTVQEALKDFDLRQPLQQGWQVNGSRWRLELARFSCLT
jgi:hypothetical protein